MEYYPKSDKLNIFYFSLNTTTKYSLKIQYIHWEFNIKIHMETTGLDLMNLFSNEDNLCDSKRYIM